MSVGGTDQLDLTSFRLGLVEEENLVVCFCACPAVLRSLPGIVVLSALHSLIKELNDIFIVFVI